MIKSYLNGLVVFPTYFNLSLNLAIRSSWSEPQSAPGLVFADCIELLHLWLQRIELVWFWFCHLYLMGICLDWFSITSWQLWYLLVSLFHKLFTYIFYQAMMIMCQYIISLQVRNGDILILLKMVISNFIVFFSLFSFKIHPPSTPLIYSCIVCMLKVGYILLKYHFIYQYLEY